MNSGSINHKELSVKYSSFYCEMAVKHAFRLFPVRHVDWKLLDMFGKDHYFIDTRLPWVVIHFFNTFANALAWSLINLFAVSYLLHYLDDFFLADNN